MTDAITAARVAVGSAEVRELDALRDLACAAELLVEGWDALPAPLRQLVQASDFSAIARRIEALRQRHAQVVAAGAASTAARRALDAAQG